MGKITGNTNQLDGKNHGFRSKMTQQNPLINGSQHGQGNRVSESEHRDLKTLALGKGHLRGDLLMAAVGWENDGTLGMIMG